MHSGENVLKAKLSEAQEKVSIGSHYYHYKSPTKLYTVLNVAVNEADEKICVIYQANYGEKIIFIRPLESWLDIVELQGKKVSRFTLV